MQVTRCDYVVYTNQSKKNGEQLSQKDLINVGYMAGRYGISLDGNLQKNDIPNVTKDGTYININSCTTDLFEQNLNSEGIKFNKIA